MSDNIILFEDILNLSNSFNNKSLEPKSETPDKPNPNADILE